MPAIPPTHYANNTDGFMPPSSGGVLAYKSVSFAHTDTTITLELPDGALVVNTIATMATAFNGTDPSVAIDLNGTAIGSFDPGNLVTQNASGKLPMRGTLVTLTIDSDESSAGLGQFVVIYAVM